MRLVIRNLTGIPSDTRVLIDGKPVERLVSFALHGDGPDHKIRLVLEVDPDEVEVDVVDPEMAKA
jgi:hypothetical protein